MNLKLVRTLMFLVLALTGCYVPQDCKELSFGLPNHILVCNASPETADAFEAKIEEAVRRYAKAGIFNEAHTEGRLRGVHIYIVHNTEGLKPEEANTFYFTDDPEHRVAGQTVCDEHLITLANRNLCWGALIHEIAHMAENCEEPPLQPADNVQDPYHATWSRRGIFKVIWDAFDACREGKEQPWDKPR
jgi:hypothetical protein